jgi:predicted nucleic acid-binding protein
LQEENRALIVDADLLSSFLKIGRLALIRDFFKVEKLYIPIAVFGEIAKTKLVKSLLDEKYVQIEKVDEKGFEGFDKDLDNLGTGEKECIALCKQFQNPLLLISDKKALRVAKSQNIAVINIPAFLLACKTTAFLNLKEISHIINDLRNEDFYEFSDDEKKRLLLP